MNFRTPVFRSPWFTVPSALPAVLSLWRERPGGPDRRVRARVRQLRWSLPERLTRQPLLTKSADLELAPLVQLFDVPVNLALGSCALMVTVAAARGLLRHLSTRGASWSVPLLVSASVPAGSQLGRSPAMYLKPAAKRKRFETGPCGLASTTPANSFFLALKRKLALSLFNG